MSVRWRSPGRVNLVGEHTDYNDGLALPFATEHACVAEVERSPVQDEASSAQLPVGGEWSGYVLGPARVLRGRGYDVPPVRVRVDSDVPVGAGLSSSGAVVCAVTCALDDLLGLALEPDVLLAVTRQVENEVVGAPTGGLDQLASLRCTEGHALFCDFGDLSAEPVPFDPGARGLAVLVVDTHAPHRLADGQYGARRQACSRAAQSLGLESLREVVDLDDALAALTDDEERRYVRHVVTENERVLRTVDLLRAGDVGAVGPVLSASHTSLRDDYRVTVPELDVAAAALEEAGALGARMTGGGFGGSVIALIDVGSVDAAVTQVEKAFAGNGFRSPTAFTVHPSAGASRL